MDSILIMRALQKVVNPFCHAGLACLALDAGIRCLLPPTPLTEGGAGGSILTEGRAERELSFLQIRNAVHFRLFGRNNIRRFYKGLTIEQVFCIILNCGFPSKQ